MKATLLLLDTAPLRDVCTGTVSSRGANALVNDAWLRDRCYFSPLSLVAGDPPGVSGGEGLETWRAREEWRRRLLGLGLQEVPLCWETIRECGRHGLFPPLSLEWFLLGVASRLDAGLVTARPSLLAVKTAPIEVIPW